MDVPDFMAPMTMKSGSRVEFVERRRLAMSEPTVRAVVVPSVDERVVRVVRTSR
jgi:hypothetical protein